MNKKISEIAEEFLAAGTSREELYELYAADTRSGVQKLIEKYKKQDAALQKERDRLEMMHTYEKEYASCGLICGIDEVGRGPLAGPVVAGAVILPADCEILYLNDSKQLSAKKETCCTMKLWKKLLQ